TLCRCWRLSAIRTRPKSTETFRCESTSFLAFCPWPVAQQKQPQTPLKVGNKRLNDRVCMTRTRLFRISQCHLFTVPIAFLSLLSICPEQQPAQPTTPEGIIHAAIGTIEQNYLQARANPLWNISRDALLAGKFSDSSQALAALQKQLPY